MPRRSILALALLFVAAACSSPARTAGVEVRTLNSDIGLGLKLDEIPSLPTSGFVFGGDLDLDFSLLSRRQSQIVGFQFRLSGTPAEFCPEPEPLDVAEKAVGFYPEGRPPPGTYLWRLWFTYKVGEEDQVLGPFFFEREVGSAPSPERDAFDITVETRGQSYWTKSRYHVITRPYTTVRDEVAGTGTEVEPGVPYPALAPNPGVGADGQRTRVEDQDPDSVKPDNIPKNVPNLRPSAAPDAVPAQPTPAIPQVDFETIPGDEIRYPVSGHMLSERRTAFRDEDGVPQENIFLPQPRVQIGAYPTQPGQIFDSTHYSTDPRTGNPVDGAPPLGAFPVIPPQTTPGVNPEAISPEDDRTETVRHQAVQQAHKVFDGCGERFFGAYATGTQTITITDNKYPDQNENGLEYTYRYAWAPQYGSMHIHDEIEFEPDSVDPGQPYKVTETLAKIKPIFSPEAP